MMKPVKIMGTEIHKWAMAQSREPGNNQSLNRNNVNWDAVCNGVWRKVHSTNDSGTVVTHIEGKTIKPLPHFIHKSKTHTDL